MPVIGAHLFDKAYGLCQSPLRPSYCIARVAALTRLHPRHHATRPRCHPSLRVRLYSRSIAAGAGRSARSNSFTAVTISPSIANRCRVQTDTYLPDRLVPATTRDGCRRATVLLPRFVSSARSLLGWVGNFPTLHCAQGVTESWLSADSADDVLHPDFSATSASAISERWHRQGTAWAHIRAIRSRPATSSKCLQGVKEFLRLHVIRKTPKRRIAPRRVGGVGVCTPQAAESGHVFIRDAHLTKCFGNVSLLNCGLCRDRGIVRMSTIRLTSWACNR